MAASLAAANANIDNWEWGAESTKRWEFAAEDWQEFNAKWYGSLCTPLHDPKLSLSLSLGPRLSALGNFPSEILVRECYGTIFDRVWATAMASESGRKIGTLITGQPGTGKTLFLFYLLVRLLQLRQVVLFTLEGNDLYLFYHGEAAPPDSIRFKIWRKKFKPRLVGLPLWTRDELAKGLPYQSQYNSFLSALRKDPSQYETDPLQLFPGTRELLAEFQEDATLEDTLDYLLEAAIDRFGHSARDVFDAIFDSSSITGMTIHQASFRLNYAHLEDTIFALLFMQNSSSVYNEMLAISPVYSGPYTDDRWTVNFKSDWVARGITQHIDIAERHSICRRILQRFPQASAVAGYFLEARHSSPSFAVSN